MGMGGGQGNSPIMILLAPSVQKELKLNDEQKSKVYTFAKTATQKNREMMQTMAFSGGNANPQAAAIGRTEIERHYHRRLTAALRGDLAPQRAALVLAIVAGVQVMRQTLALPALAQAPSAALVTILTPIFQQLVDGPRRGGGKAPMATPKASARRTPPTRRRA